MQTPLAVCILVKCQQLESCLELFSYLLFKRMGELYAGVFRLKPPSVVRVAQRVERKTVDNPFFFAVHNVVDIVIGPGQQPAARGK